MAKGQSASGRVRRSDRVEATVEQLKGKTYAVFTSGGMRVDLQAYFASESGRKAIRAVTASSKKK